MPEIRISSVGCAPMPALSPKGVSVVRTIIILDNPLMPEYRRVLIKGGTYFMTFITYQRREIFSSPDVRDLFFTALLKTKQYNPFDVVAYCLLPDHIHMIWQLPEKDSDFSNRVSVLKRRFSKSYTEKYGLSIPKDPSRSKRREVTIWQRRFWEHYIRDTDDLHRHIDYIHYNPVKHGLVKRVCDWSVSSFHDYARAGLYDLDWGDESIIMDRNHNYGE